MEKSTFLRRFAFRRKHLMRGQQFNCHVILKCKGLKNEMLLTKKVLGPRVKRSLRSKTLEVISMLPCIPKQLSGRYIQKKTQSWLFCFFFFIMKDISEEKAIIFYQSTNAVWQLRTLESHQSCSLRGSLYRFFKQQQQTNEKERKKFSINKSKLSDAKNQEK